MDNCETLESRDPESSLASDNCESESRRPSGSASQVQDEFDQFAENQRDHFEAVHMSRKEDGGASNYSELSEKDWKPCSGNTTRSLQWVNQQIIDGISPRLILSHLLPDSEIEIPDEVEGGHLWHFIIQLLTEPRRRKKLLEYSTLEDAVELIRSSSKIIVITGAGVSVSCGIPDFRSKDGIYDRLHRDFPDLPNPQAMFDIDYFKKNQGPFYDFAKEIYPGQFQPSKCHKFIKMLEDQGKLLRNYTQNIDTLEQVAGIKRVVQCHGSFATASCCTCKYQVDCEAIRQDIMEKRIPMCLKCAEGTEMAVMKPDIVFFGENLPQHFHEQIMSDKDETDLLIVIGSSMKVRPVALIPNSIKEEIPQIVIDRRILDHLNFDIDLLGHCDEVIEEICLHLGAPWNQLVDSDRKECLRRVTEGELEYPEEIKTLLRANVDELKDYELSSKTVNSPENLNRKSPSDNAEESVETDVFDAPSSAKKPKLIDIAETSDAKAKSEDDSHGEKFQCLDRSGAADNVSDESATERLDKLQTISKPRFVNLASLVPEGAYLFLEPNQTIFKSAEVLKTMDGFSGHDSSDSSDRPIGLGCDEGREGHVNQRKTGGEDSDSSNSEYRLSSPGNGIIQEKPGSTEYFTAVENKNPPKAE